MLDFVADVGRGEVVEEALEVIFYFEVLIGLLLVFALVIFLVQ